MQKQFLFWNNPKDAILTIMGILLVMGCINVFSASFVRALDETGNGYHYFYRYLLMLSIGLFLFWLVGWKINYKTLLKFSRILCLGGVATLVAVMFMGVVVNGSRRWIYLGSIGLQPSEFMKLFLIMLAAQHLGTRMRQAKCVSLFKSSDILPIFMAVISFLLVYKQPDLGTAAILVAMVLFIYVLAGISKFEWTVLGMGALGLLPVLAYGAAYRVERIKLWLDPWQDAQGGGYQIVQSLLSIGSGGWLGKTFGMGTSKFYFLPEAHTDFAFAVYCQEWGFFGAVFVLVLFAILGRAIHEVALNTTDERGFLLVCGANLLVVGQAVANMMMVSGTLPVIGVPMPFISYGGSSLFITLGAIACVVAVYREEVTQSEERQKVAGAFEERKKILSSKRARGWPS